MKKIVFSVAMLLFSQWAFSQSFGLGLRAGANIASLTGGASTSNVTGLQAAIVSEIKFGSWSIVPELVYSQQGTNISGTDFKLNNLNIPVQLRYSLGAKIARVFLNTGPQFGINLSTSDLAATSVKTSDFGWVFGGGAALKWGHGELFADARYTLGLVNVATVTGGDYKNGVIGISIGYLYKFGL